MKPYIVVDGRAADEMVVCDVEPRSSVGGPRLPIELHLCSLAGANPASLDRLTKILHEIDPSELETREIGAQRRSFIVARSLLRCVLSATADFPPSDWSFQRETNGRPRIARPTSDFRSFNISYSRDVIAIAVCRPPFHVGVDIEFPEEERASLRTARGFCTLREMLALLSSEDSAHFTATFFNFWTLKESYLKALGVGIGDHLLYCNCYLDPLHIHDSIGFAGNKLVSFWQGRLNFGAVMAICVIGRESVTPTPQFFNWTVQSIIESLEDWTNMRG